MKINLIRINFKSVFFLLFIFLKRLCTLCNIPLEVYDIMVIFLIHQRGCDHKIGCCPVIGDRDIVYLCHTEQCFYIRVMRCRGKWVRKEYYKINSSLYDLCTNLLVTTKRTAIVALYRKSGSIRNHAGGCPCSA